MLSMRDMPTPSIMYCGGKQSYPPSAERQQMLTTVPPGFMAADTAFWPFIIIKLELIAYLIACC